jgi:hypothetical protein
VSETPQEAFRRGEVAGQTESRLTGAEDHLMRINGHIRDMVSELKALRLDVQALGDAATAAANTAVALATALKEAEEQRRDKSEQSWSPLARLSAIVVAIAAITGVYLAIKGHP